MANGTLVDQATYYNDTTTYTGESGSETNKYVIEDIYDFCAIGTNTGYYELINDIDFNDHSTYKNGIDCSGNRYLIKNTDIYIEGNNHKIYNMICKNVTGSNATLQIGSMNSAFFINLVCIGCTANVIHGTYEHCSFGIYLCGASMIDGVITTEITYIDCTLNITGTTKTYYSGSTAITNQFMRGAKLTRTHINFHNLNVSFVYGSSTTTINLICNSTLENSYITGTLNCIDSSEITNMYMLYSVTSMNSSFIALKFDNFNISNENKNIINGGSVSSVSFIDYELYGSTATSSVNNLHLLTTEQAMSPTYLESIGFPVLQLT